MVQEGIRKGPWTEHEDVQLVFYVKLFGDRRWDFVAKVSGLKRTGKSCRLRWVNYLHPGLKHGKMTPNEERLVIELQSKWGNRWSRIARKLPGRTDNEIKNYWRTHMRKQAQDRKRAVSPTPSTSNSSSFESNDPPVDSMPFMETKDRSFYDTGGLEMLAPRGKNTKQEEEGIEKGYSLDDIWKEIPLFEIDTTKGYSEEGCNFSSQTMASPIWNYFPDMLSMMDEEESSVFVPTVTGQIFAGYEQL
ncbi:hypothetical protein RHMOL_Rhmol01G0305700 [Rhododendron molle]|uniref:Uncharacterized protein n=1 Tax=Rhododendron molle TaxID=49168 RepID=A0ACC0Q8S9_RHOML|nr:hypothetical protein RHMOL_Rhmol01G0305700 [Rhododendron molle]